MATVLTVGSITSSEYHCGPVRALDRHAESKVDLREDTGAEKGLCTELQACTCSGLGGTGSGQTGAKGLCGAEQQGTRVSQPPSMWSYLSYAG